MRGQTFYLYFRSYSKFKKNTWKWKSWFFNV